MLYLKITRYFSHPYPTRPGAKCDVTDTFGDATGKSSKRIENAWAKIDESLMQTQLQQYFPYLNCDQVFLFCHTQLRSSPIPYNFSDTF